MKRVLSLITAASVAFACMTPAFANGRGVPVDPVKPRANLPQPITPLPPVAQPAPQYIVRTQAGQNWWLIVLGLVVAVGVVVVCTDDDNTN